MFAKWSWALWPLLVFAAGCASNDKMIISDPPGATVNVNGDPIGVTPIKYTFDFSRRSSYQVAVTKDGFIGVDRVIYSETPAANQSELRYDLERDPSWADTTDCAAANKWVEVQISPDFTQQSMWPRLIQLVVSHYPEIEQLDPASGYIRTVPVTRVYKTTTGGENSVRTYLQTSIFTTDPLVLQVQIVAERSVGPNNWARWQRVFIADQKLFEEIQNRLGIKG
jgi:hypothetical protein